MNKTRSTILFIVLETALFLAPAIEKEPMTARQAEAIMDGWFMSYYGHPSKVHIGGVDERCKGEGAWGDKGIFYVGYYDERPYEIVNHPLGGSSVIGTGFEWFGKGKTIEDALYNCLEGGHGPMKFMGYFPTGSPDWEWDEEEEARFIKSIGRKNIERGK